MAYRKAKVDLFYSSEPRRRDLLDYESNLTERLEALLEAIQSAEAQWVKESSFLGGAYVTPKAMVRDPARTSERMEDRWSEPSRRWQSEYGSGAKAKAQFRVMAMCGIDMHVLSSLWIDKVGSLLEAELSASARGNRLRRTRDHQFNHWGSGSFGPYLRPYRKWRDDGFDVAAAALNADKSVAVITADVASYYHSLDPSFLLDNEFLELFETRLDPGQRDLHRLFVEALRAWPAAASKALGFGVRGLPVGLPASGVVANLALIEFDRLIETEVKPLYYGRYVDDIILVLRDDPVGTSDLWEWLSARMDEMLRIAPDAKHIERGYLRGSTVKLNAEKTKTLRLSGPTGIALIGSIARAVAERSSEWRSLPSLPDEPSGVATDIAQVFQADGERADSFRGVDVMTARRSAFALRLRDYEAYSMDVDPSSWAAIRHKFYEAVSDYALTLPGYFELSPYVGRVVRLAVACGDFEQVPKLIGQLVSIDGALEDVALTTVKGARVGEKHIARAAKAWASHAFRQLADDVVAALTAEPSDQEWGKVLEAFGAKVARTALPQSGGAAWAIREELFARDLAHRAFREAFSGDGVQRDDVEGLSKVDEAVALLPVDLLQRLAQVMELAARETAAQVRGAAGVPAGIAFATRPFTLIDLLLLARPFGDNRDAFDADMRRVESALLALRGYHVEGVLPAPPGPDDEPNDLVLPGPTEARKQRVALGIVTTSGTSWTAAAVNTPDLSPGRYKRLNETVSELLRSPRNADYLVLPELSVPVRWFHRYAYKLRSQGIGLVAGVEYQHHGVDEVRNQVWATLALDGGTFPATFLHRQDKQKPAVHEKDALAAVGGKRLVPEVAWHSVPVLHHNGFSFALLVCSELTNIDYRAQLRGKVDALVLPAWNRDLNTFNALVESAALDVHTHVVLANDRRYGDSRVRAPMAKEWLRELLRVRGGVENFVVMTDLDVPALRAHHSSFAPRDGAYKPLPDGFEIGAHRRTVPTVPKGM